MNQLYRQRHCFGPAWARYMLVVCIAWSTPSFSFAQTGGLAPIESQFVNPNQMEFEADVEISSDRNVSWANYEATRLASNKFNDRLKNSIPQTVEVSANPLTTATKPNANSLAKMDEISFENRSATESERSSLMGFELGKIDWQKMLTSLGIVLGGYLLIVWMLRKANPGWSRKIPSQVVEVLGVVRLDQRQQLQLIRLGSKLLLVSNGPDGTNNIGEIDDPIEVENLLALCGLESSPTAPRKSSSRKSTRSQIAASENGLENLVRSLQQAIRRPTGQAEFEA